VWRRRTIATAAVGGGLSIAALFGLSQGGGTIDVFVGSTPTAVAANTANIWIDQNGGTCVRNASAIIYTGTGDTQSCASIQAALTACTAGDAMRMKAGTYATTQTITTDRTSACPIIAENGTTVNVMTAGGNNLDITNLDVVDLELANDPTGVTFRSSRIGGSGITYLSGPATNVTFTGTSFHDTVDGGNPGAVYVVGNSLAEQINNVVFDGDSFTNLDCTSTPGNHYEAMRVQGYVNGLTVRDSSFSGNAVDTSQIFFTSLTAGAAHTPSGTMLVENNNFGAPEAGNCGGAASLMLNLNMQGGACPVINARYNTAPTTYIGPVLTGNCTGGGPVTITANISQKLGGGCDATFAANLWLNASSANCGTGDQTVADTAAAGLTGDGYHISGSSPARAAGKAGDCPADDHDAQGRPQPAATTCDAGSDEVG
jgi:hypothetical protein